MSLSATPVPRRLEFRLELLLVAYVFVGVEYYLEFRDQSPWILWSPLVWDLFFTQPALLAMGIVLPLRARLFRVALATVGVPLCLGSLKFVGEPNHFSYFLLIFCWTLCGCLMLRRRGLTIKWVPVSQRGQVCPFLKFGILDVFVVMSLFGAVLASQIWIQTKYAPEGTLTRDIQDHLFKLVVAVTYMSSALLSLWAALGGPRLWLRTGCGICGVIALALSLAWQMDDSETFWIFFGSVTLVSLYTYLALLVVRSCGYRLVQNPAACALMQKETVASQKGGPALEAQ